MTGAAPDQLIELRSHELPVGCEYLWEWFIRLHATRPVGFSSAGPISETELWSFFRLRRIEPEQWELDALLAMDSAAMEAMLEDAPPPPGTEDE